VFFYNKSHYPPAGGASALLIIAELRSAATNLAVGKSCLTAGRCDYELKQIDSIVQQEVKLCLFQNKI